ncbi:hypothetical protein [Gemelliphila asaccharolytica]|uniref:Uncharacterized protein n=1 Tax=Gemelliphila asaccharolytica TaxID=502393 RepID=A0ABR5TPD4_9BACL|nr:hypothetical protein [Gemella asaccharolytica]KXB58208.1 hypothetical protein HMPREF1871_00596 [Gemella asaccharolytica]
MFEYYSLADLFCNIRKKLKINLILLIVIFLLVSIPLSYKTFNKKEGKKSDTYFSSYMVYKIDTKERIPEKTNDKYGGYSNFYEKLIFSNINGALLFNGVEEEKLKEIATSLGTDVKALKSSNKEFWEKKVYVTPIAENKGVSVEILTPSKELNTLMEVKIDSIVNEYKNTYKDVSVEKLNTVYSDDKKDAVINTSYSGNSLIIKLVIVFILSVVLVAGLNFLIYIFNPTINRLGDFNKYKEIKKIFDIDKDSDINIVKSYYKEDVTLITSSNKIKLRLLNKGIQVILPKEVKDFVNLKNVVFIEEYGLTRYRNFEKVLQNLNNFDKNILSVISYKL